MWYVFALAIGFALFICPGLVDPKADMRRHAALIFAYIAAFFTSFLLFVLNEDFDSPNRYYFIFLPIWIVNIVHIL